MKEEVVVIIPAFNEENAISKVLADIPKDLVSEVIVVDNNSSDYTIEAAKHGGATVLTESFQGYGAACLKGIAYCRENRRSTDIVVFLDADYSDYPEELPLLLEPLLKGNADLVVGSRALGNRSRGSMTLPQLFGNWLAATLLNMRFGKKVTDLGPFRAVKYRSLLALDMQDRTYGWTVEMQLKALRSGMNYVEVPVSYRPRIGHSKISGTVKGTFMAGYKILSIIFRNS